MDSIQRPENQGAQQYILNHCISGDVVSLQKSLETLRNIVQKAFPDGQTCLIAACRNGKLDVATFLIDDCGADVEQVGSVEFEGEQVEGVPPLWCAAAAGHLDIVALLVSRGANVNRTTITNSTALRAACFDGRMNVVHFLVEHGANLEIPNRHGHTCLMISCYRRHHEIVEYLLNKKARVNRRSAKGNTALHDCAESGNLKSLQLLLKHGAIMRKDEYGQSPIMSGASASFSKIVEFLDNYTGSGDSPNLGGRSSQLTDNSAVIGPAEKVAAYELLGASLFDRSSLVQDAVRAWLKALSLREEAGLYPKRLTGGGSQRTPCRCDCKRTTGRRADSSLSVGGSDDDTGSLTAWSLVSTAAREAVSGMELLRGTTTTNATSCSGAAPSPSIIAGLPRHRFSLLLTSAPARRSAGQTRRRRRAYDQPYLAKWRHLQAELQVVYTRRVEVVLSVQPLHVGRSCPGRVPPAVESLRWCDRLGLLDSGEGSAASMTAPKTTGLAQQQSSSLADTILGIEPVCFVLTRGHRAGSAADLPSSYYLQRRWHSSDYCTPPRNASSRCCSYRVCTVCRRMEIRFGGGELDHPVPSSSSSLTSGCPTTTDWLCPGCTAVAAVHEIGDQMMEDSSLFTLAPDNLYRPPVSHPRITRAGVDNQLTAAATEVCPHCGLVSEQHPLLQRLRRCGQEAFGEVREFTSKEELTEMMRSPPALCLQPLLIRLRLLGPNHPDAVYFIRYRGAVYAGADDYQLCLNLWRYALELQRIFLEPLCHVSQTAFISFAELFQYVLSNNLPNFPPAAIDPVLIVDCLELSVDSIERGMDYSFFRWYRRHPWSYTTADKEAINLMRHVAVCLHFTSMLLSHYLPSEEQQHVATEADTDVGSSPAQLPLSPRPLRTSRLRALFQLGPGIVDFVAEAKRRRLGPVDQAAGLCCSPSSSGGAAADASLNRANPYPRLSLSPALKHRFFSQVYRLVRLDPRVHHGHGLIHLACSPETSIVGRFVICQFPNPPVVRLLLQLGADPDCLDVHGQRALGHVLAHRRLLRATQASLLAALVEGGAHLDAYNRPIVCAADAKFRHVLLQSGICPVRHRSLACLAASVMRRHGLSSSHPVVNAYLPHHLSTFLDMH